MALPVTNLQYYQDAYQTSLPTRVVEVVSEGETTQVYLEDTIFFPQGGGQPSDQGVIKGPAGQAMVQRVTMQDEVVCHWAVLEDELKPDDEVVCELNWERRHWYMRVHTAGHLVHDAFMSLVDGLVPHRGEHGDNPYVKYRGTVDTGNLQQKLETLVNELIAEDRVVVTEEATLEELSQRAKFVPPNLPQGKPLRIMQISGFDAMPDGGVHVKTLGEIKKIVISDIRCKKGGTTVKYQVS
jgi:Ser-tRNA(Ala) deacylase AlaX